MNTQTLSSGDQHSNALATQELDNIITQNEIYAEQALRRKKAEQLINRNILIAVGCGLLPMPLVDAAGVATIEIVMIGELAKIYGFPFPNRLALIKMFLSVVGSIGSIYVVSHSRSALTTIPLIGYLASATVYSMANGVAVFAVGKVFQHHFESGGTLLSLDKKSTKKLYHSEYQRGKLVVPQLVAAHAGT